MSDVRKFRPYALALVLLLIVIVMIFRDEVHKKSGQQQIATKMMKNDTGILLPMLKLSQQLDSIQ